MPGWWTIPVAYLIGSISFAVVVSKLFALPDPHSYGSGNPGATNVLRTGNKAAAALTLFGDGAKGWLAVFLAKQFGPSDMPPLILAGVALAVFLGHLFPVFHKFRGGKGVATAAGIMLALDWRLAAAAFVVWFVVAVVLKISSISALFAAAVAPFVAFYLYGNSPLAWVWVLLTLLLVWRHKANIQKLLQGKETTIGR